MKLEFNLPKFRRPEFKVPEFKRPINLFTGEGIKAVGIVLGAIVVISGVAYSARLVGRSASTVLPAAIEVETTVTPEVTEAPLEIPTEAPVATTSPTIKATISPAAE